MLKKISIVLTAFVITPSLFAAISGKVIEVDPSSEEVAIETKSRLVRVGDVFILSGMKSQKNCQLSIEEVNGSTLIASTENCPLKIKNGQRVVKSSLQQRQSRRNQVSRRNSQNTQSHFRQRAMIQPNQDESWYTLWGLGTASNKYNSEFQESVDYLNSHSNVSSGSLSMDLLGFYWPLSNKKTMMGFIINTASDTWTSKSNSSASASVSHNLYGFSAQHFFNSNIGEGWFARADLGYTVYSISSGSEFLAKDSGTGMLLGGGYSWPFKSGDTRFMLSFLGSSKKSGLVSTRTFSLMGGFLF